MRRLAIVAAVVAVLGLSVGAAAAASFAYTGDVLPTDDGWTQSTSRPYATLESDGGRGVLHINDTGVLNHDHLHYWRGWDVVPYGSCSTATFVMRNVSCSGLLGTYFGIQQEYTDGSGYHAMFAIYPDRVEYFSGEHEDYLFDTASGYHTYTVTLSEDTVSLTIDGSEAMSFVAEVGTEFGRNGVEFGAGSSPVTGEAYWDYVSGAQTLVPEPTSLSLFALCAVAVLRRKR